MSTAAAEGYLFDMPEPSGFTAPLNGWEDRMGVLQDLGREREGLVPRSILPDILDVSRQRVKELVDREQLEVIHFYGVEFISGRSIREYKQGLHRAAGGRGHKRPSLWKSMVIGAKIGKALADVAVPD